MHYVGIGVKLKYRRVVAKREDLRDSGASWHYWGMKNTLEKSWIPTDDEFNIRLAMVRTMMDWNETEASLKCGFSPNNWANWERGATPRGYPDVCKKIAERTGVDVTWLMMGTKLQQRDYQVEVSRPALRSRPANRTDLSGPRSRP